MATGLLFLSAITLGCVFIAAGVAKLLQRGRAGDHTIERLLLPGQLAAVQGRVLPYVELAVGVLLLASLATGGAALREAPFALATFLLATFAVAIALALARSEEVECHCFGGLGSGRVTRQTLGRSVGLLILAAGGGASACLAPPCAVAALAPRAALPLLIIAVSGLGLAVMASEAWAPEARSSVREERGEGR